MKRNILIAVALAATMTAAAQNIAVVSPSNETEIYQTLDEAINNAEGGSTIYLPGGGIQISDAIRIDKRLTIMGVSHRADTDNSEGATIIGGNLHFVKGSSYSAVLGAFISGDVIIGEDGASVNYVTIKKCNLNSIQVKNSTCIGTEVNQNYIRRASEFGGSNPTITNNILYTIGGVSGGTITHNIVVNNYYLHVINVSNCTISYNVFFHCIGGASNNGFCLGGNNQGTDNMYPNDHSNYAQFDRRIILPSGVSWNDVFVTNAGISPSSNFHFNENYKEYEDKVGIYAGSGFDPYALAPIPRIISKKVDEQSNASGKLTINVTVKAK